jgi:signal transduction histidine kinase
MKAASRYAQLAGTLAVVALAAATSWLAAAHGDAALGGGDLWESVLQAGAAVAATGSGLGMVVNRRMVACGLLLALTGPEILLAQLPAQDSGSAVVFTAALVGGQLAPFLAGSAALACPVTPMRRLDWVIIAVSLAVAGAVRGLLPAAVFDPRASGCFTCPANLTEVRSDPALYAALDRWGLVLTIAAGAGLAARAGWRLIRAPRILRLVNAPVVIGGMAAALLASAGAAYTLQLPAPEIDAAERMLWLATCCCVAMMAADVPASRLRARWLAGKVSGAVLAALPSPDSLRAALAGSIGDPDLALVFFREDGSVIDAVGRRVAGADHQLAVIRVARADTAVAEIWYRRDLASASHQLAAAVRAAGLATEHAAAGARLRAELADLAESRQRIVDLSDAERRRLERDLHDGAQQRLIALQVLLEIAASAAPPVLSASYTRARQDVGVALEQLRDLAHGIYPAALTDAGLGVGLRTLAEISPVPIVVNGPDPHRQPPIVEAAAYRIVAGAVHAAGQHPCHPAVTVTITESDDMLRVRLSTSGLDEGTGERVIAATRDRIAAAGGIVTLAAAGDQTTIEAVIPCAS